jgi:hypothetical protein
MIDQLHQQVERMANVLKALEAVMTAANKLPEEKRPAFIFACAKRLARRDIDVEDAIKEVSDAARLQ